MRTQNQVNGPEVLPPPLRPRPGAAPAQAPELGSVARRTVVAVLIAILLLALAYLLWRGVHVLLQAFAGVLFAVFLSALAEGLRKWTRLPYGWALAIVLCALFLLAGGLGWFLANHLAQQARELSARLPQSLEQLREYLSERPWGRLVLDHAPDAREHLGRLGQFGDVGGMLSGVTSFLVTLLVILFVGIFGAAEPGLYRAGLLHLIPPAQRPRAEEALDALVFNLRWWIVGQVFLMFLMWVTTTAGLWLIGIPFALVLGLIAGLLELVPYVGPWISAVPAALIAMTVSPTHLVLVLALYLALHIVESYIVVPLVQRRAVHLPPAVTLVAQVLLGELLGIMGLFVAAPLTLCAVVLLKMLYVEDALGDHRVDVPGEPGNEQKQLPAEGAVS